MFVSNQYKKDIGNNYKPISKVEEIATLHLAKLGWQKAIDKIVFSQLLMVVNIVKEHTKDTSIFEDLINAGICGLVKAIAPFDFERDTRFNTYACHWVRVEVIRAIVRNGTIRLPDHLAAKLSKQKKLLRMGKTVDENGEAIDEQSVLEFSYHSMNELKEDDLTLEEKLGHEDDNFAINEDKNHIAFLLQFLNSSQRTVIELLFGLNGNKVHTEEEAGLILKVTKQRVSQIKHDALKKLELKSKILLK
jgi:RNA polymerase primary sigma factor